jgi:hypothetical protein
VKSFNTSDQLGSEQIYFVNLDLTLNLSGQVFEKLRFFRLGQTPIRPVLSDQKW